MPKCWQGSWQLGKEAWSLEEWSGLESERGCRPMGVATAATEGRNIGGEEAQLSEPGVAKRVLGWGCRRSRGLCVCVWCQGFMHAQL